MEKALPFVSIFLAAYGIAFSGAIMPGPLLAVTIDAVPRRGAWAGPLVVIGHAVLEAALVGALAFGFASWLARPAVTTLISLLGGVMLLWMGSDMLRRASRLTMPDAPAAGRSSSNLIGAGIVTSLANPYWSLWWATIGLGYLVAALKTGLAGVVVFFVGHILADCTWYTFVSVSLSRSRRLTAGPGYRWLVRVCGTALLGFALWFLVSGARSATVWLGRR